MAVARLFLAKIIRIERRLSLKKYSCVLGVNIDDVLLSTCSVLKCCAIQVALEICIKFYSVDDSEQDDLARPFKF